jgi:polar amino acid transport system permease protein
MGLDEWIELLQAAWTTAWISVVSIVMGIIAALIIAIIREKKIPFITQILTFYISITRAVPLVTLTLFVFLSIPAFGINLNCITAGIISLTVNTTAFNAEIFRSALEKFSHDQKEAAYSIGMTNWTFYRYIMLPQIFTISLPALVNEMSFLIKGTPAVAMIGVIDLTRVTNQISAVTYEPMPPILCAGLIYMVMISLLVKAQRVAEKKAHRLAM